MTVELISIPGCPFVQRTAVLLYEKQVPFEVQEIDPRNKPEWFLKISPFGRVPVLVVDGTPIFESSAIIEYLEETHPEPPLYPKDPILRARDRGWLSGAAEELYKPMVTMLKQPDQAAAAKASLDARLARIEQELGDHQWLSDGGARFGIADLATVPCLSRLPIYERIGLYTPPAGLPRLDALRERLCARESVARSLPPNHEEELRHRLAGAQPASRTDDRL
jgi:glutathione S-transferase